MAILITSGLNNAIAATLITAIIETIDNVDVCEVNNHYIEIPDIPKEIIINNEPYKPWGKKHRRRCKY